MNAAIGPGDWVECLDIDTSRTSHQRRYHTGEICQVEEVGEDEFGPWLNCVGKVRPADYGDPEQPGFDLEYFRPIHPGGALTRLLMEPVSDRIAPGVSRKSRQDQPAHDEPVSNHPFGRAS